MSSRSPPRPVLRRSSCVGCRSPNVTLNDPFRSRCSRCLNTGVDPRTGASRRRSRSRSPRRRTNRSRNNDGKPKRSSRRSRRRRSKRRSRRSRK